MLVKDPLARLGHDDISLSTVRKHPFFDTVRAGGSTLVYLPLRLHAVYLSEHLLSANELGCLLACPRSLRVPACSSTGRQWYSTGWSP